MSFKVEAEEKGRKQGRVTYDYYYVTRDDRELTYDVRHDDVFGLFWVSNRQTDTPLKSGGETHRQVVAAVEAHLSKPVPEPVPEPEDPVVEPEDPVVEPEDPEEPPVEEPTE